MHPTYQLLLESRSNFKDGKPQGMEWTPYKMPFYPLAEECGIPSTIYRLLALAIHLEMPVGAWIGQATNQDLPISKTAKNLLLSNIADETVHQKAFEFMAEDYQVGELQLKEAAIIAAQWNDSLAHPLQKAAVAECGLFLCFLTIMRVFGGESLSYVAVNVSKDEFRHVATNVGILKDIGHPLHESDSYLNRLRLQTLQWAIEPLTVPGFGADFFIRQSDSLLKSGIAPELEELTSIAEDISSFEIANQLQSY